MGNWEYLSFEVYWKSSLLQIRSAYSAGCRLDHLEEAGLFELGDHLRELREQGWNSFAWNSSADGMHEVFIFKRLVPLAVWTLAFAAASAVV